jgi:hypothetical protein
VADICREHEISEATYYTWKKKYSGLGLNELRELRHLREENGKPSGWLRIALSTRRLSGLMMIDRTTMNHQSRRDPQHTLRVRLRELAGSTASRGQFAQSLSKRPVIWPLAPVT